MHSHLSWKWNIECFNALTPLLGIGHFFECLDALMTRFSTHDLQGSVKQEKQ